MNWQDVRESLLRVARLLQRNRRDRELTEELEFHLALKQQKYIQTNGLAPQQAATQALRDLGGLERWKEVCRDVARFRAIEEFGRDLVLAARLLRKAPVFTLVAVFTLTAAIGANTAIFSLLNAILLKPLMVPEADRLAILRIQPDQFGYTFNYPLYKQLELRARPLFRTFAFTGRDLQLHTNEGVERVAGQLVSGEYFSALQVHPQLGRWIGPSDDRPGAPGGAVAVISHRFWLAHMSGDPRVLGRRLIVNNAVFTIVGVMPKGFRETIRTSSRISSSPSNWSRSLTRRLAILPPVTGPGGSKWAHAWQTVFRWNVSMHSSAPYRATCSRPLRPA
jgi:hypothetical protein